MTTAVKTNPELWKKIQTKWKKSSTGGKAGQWNARKAQLAVQEYKRLGGTYKGPKSSKNSLAKWTKEKWGYIDLCCGKDREKSGNRYLPEAVRKKLTPAEKRVTNMQKKRATKQGKQYVPYSTSVVKKMHALKII
jgi:hypothetical protein